ncbi:diacylglycerol/lipid kinase family protein [Gillisia sp. Q332]|uniref:diacylglycerol/lipid kinase family protein n=1 Tax=Gillisia xinjiangensis TaxID=3384765 RepID=UPI0039192F9E
MSAIKNVLLVVNPISGALDKANLIQQIELEVKKINAHLNIFLTTGLEDLLNLEKKIRELKPCRILIAGGDGTIKLTAEALKGEDIPVGIIPAGSANGLASNLQLTVSIEEQIHIALGNTFQKIDIIVINEEYCLHIADFGINAELIGKYAESNIRGKLGYVLNSIPTLLDSEYPFQFKIEANNQTFEKEGILLAIANANSYGTGAKVNPKGKINDGYFEILIFKHFDFFKILKTLRNEVDYDPEFMETISTQEAIISCTSPVAFQIDGEYLGRKESIRAKILPNQLTVAIPEKIV